MQGKCFGFCLLGISCLIASAQTIKVLPYLQDAEPNSVVIMWETDSTDESIVEWGITESLENTTSGNAEAIQGDSRLHTVKLEGLERFTKYFYRVKTGSAMSETYRFKTPPFAGDQHSFRMVAMSDMQRDASQPDKYREIVEEGVIEYLHDEFGGDLIDQLALVLIPGDLVANGLDYSSWEETFFTPSEELMSQVPFYPVPGNHEYNSIYYFQYFKMPENGFEEHWWYKVRQYARDRSRF